VGGGTISTGINNLNPFQGAVNPYTGTFGTTPGGFAIAAGANIQCVFNVSAGAARDVVAPAWRHAVTAGRTWSVRAHAASMSQRVDVLRMLPCPPHARTHTHTHARTHTHTHAHTHTPGTGSAPQGNLYAQATTTASYVGAGGNTAISQSIPIDFTGPTQQWNLGGCITFT
jgi:hypothetical protein